jgi:hypothetical protein
MTDLFDRVAARSLGLGLTLRPRSRSRFEPATDMPSLEMPPMEPPDVEAITPTVSSHAPRNPVTGPIPVASATEGAGWAPEPDVLAGTDDDPIAGSANQQIGPPMGQSLRHPMLPPEVPREAAARAMPAPSVLDSRSADDRQSRIRIGVPSEALRIPSGSYAARADALPDRLPARALEHDGPPRRALRTTISPRPRSAPGLPLGEASTAAALPPDRPSTVAAILPDGPLLAAALLDPSLRPLTSATVQSVTATIERDEAPDSQVLSPPQAPRQATGGPPSSRPQDNSTGPRFERSPTPAIEVTIGRLEIRGEPLPGPRSAKPFRPHIDLAAYRASRERGR